MVKETWIDVWECPYCFSIYFDEDECLECIEECTSDRKKPIESAQRSWECELCRREFKKKRDAENCEKRHQEKEDSLYWNFTHKEMLKAGRHINQRKLRECKH